MKELRVRVIYRDKDLRPTCDKTYSLPEYTEGLKSDLQALVSEVETLGYIANGNKPKEEWTDASFELFSRIKHKLLDKAGEISRLPSNIVMRETEPLSEYVARLLNEGGDVYGESRVGS